MSTFIPARLTFIKKSALSGLSLLFAGLLGTAPAFAQSSPSTNDPAAKYSHNGSPYRDFDFILGRWEFRSPEGIKMGDQVISTRGGGLVIVEEWTEATGNTGVGMSFVDPKTGLWRQVWTSSRFHIDYSGQLDESGSMVLEGTMHPTNGDRSSLIRGIWSKQANGSVKKEFMRFDEIEKQWKTFFMGFAYPKRTGAS